MNDHSLPEHLQSFAARLAAHRPQVATDEKDQLIYACAFAAGQNAAVRSMRRWRKATAVLSVLLLAAIFRYVHEPARVATQPVEPPAAREEPPAVVTVETGMVATGDRAPALDAWQIRRPVADELDHQLAQLEKADPNLRALTVENLTRALSKP